MAKYGKIELKHYTVSEQLFDEILAAGYKVDIITDVETFDTYKFGYPERSVIKYNDFNQMIVLECILNEHYPLKDTDITYWKQVILTKDAGQKTLCEKSITGGQAYAIVNKILQKYYSADEIHEIMCAHEAEYDETKAQFHYTEMVEQYKIERYDNCYKYDINGAHNDALRELFPLAAHEFERMYNERKEKPLNKQIVNFFVGCLCRKGYRKTYNWIVQRTTSILFKGMDAVGGKLLYANTDGFMVQNPNAMLEPSKKLGGFKLEYQGTAWFYFDKNYWLFETEDGDKKGSVFYTVRDLINLRAGIVVHYDRIKDKNNYYVATNIIQEELTNGK